MTKGANSILFEAAAGSGKTTKLASLALASSEKRVLFTTYTDENTEEIAASLMRMNGQPPQNIDLMPWFTFLLRHYVKPFLWHAGFDLDSVSGILLVNTQSALRTRKDSVEHYLSSDRRVYTDKLAELALYINEKTHGAVIARLASIYDSFFIDEAQDLSGYDLELVETMLRSGLFLSLAADHRQATYHTNNSSKNNKYRSLGLSRFLTDRKLTELCSIDSQSLAGCHRCNQQILDVANALYPDLTAAKSIRSLQEEDTVLPALHIVLDKDIEQYRKRWLPAILRSSTKTNVPEKYKPHNFGASKGRTYDRVLIYPTEPIRKWLRDPTAELKPQARAKFYVALTRARFSVGIVGNNALSNMANIPLWKG